MAELIYVETVLGRVALRSAGSGSLPPLLCIHGNSSSSRIFKPIFDSNIPSVRRVLAIDLLGHGDSSNATDPEKAYTMPGYANTAIEVLQHLKIENVVVVGWSLGGHIGVEMLPRFQGVKGVMIIGSLLMALRESPQYLDDFRTKWNMREDLGEEDLTWFAKSGTGGPYEEWMADVAMRTHGKARTVLFSNLGYGDCSDQQKLVATTNVSTAVVIGVDEPHIDNSEIKKLKYNNLWSGKIVEMEGCEHCPMWEKPDMFVPILEQFVIDVAA